MKTRGQAAPVQMHIRKEIHHAKWGGEVALKTAQTPYKALGSIPDHHQKSNFRFGKNFQKDEQAK